MKLFPEASYTSGVAVYHWVRTMYRVRLFLPDMNSTSSVTLNSGKMEFIHFYGHSGSGTHLCCLLKDSFVKRVWFLKMQKKSVWASLLFKAILTVLLNLELDEGLLAMDSDSERFTSKYNHICAKHGLPTCFLKIYIPFGYLFSPIFTCNPCLLREIYNGGF